MSIFLVAEGFQVHVKKGQRVKQGDLLVTFNLDRVKEKASSTITPMIISNQSTGKVEIPDNTEAIAGKTTVLIITI